MGYAYQPLLQHIARSSAAQLDMSYAEIEDVLGRSLPPSARSQKVKRQWWANTDTHSQAKAWLANGRKAKLDAKNDVVTFYRPETAASVMSTAPVTIPIAVASLNLATIRWLEDYMDERGLDQAQAVAELLNQTALRRRRETLDWFAQNTTFSPTPSSDLIRASRDER